uniref:Putative LOC100575639 [Acyrthosiphon pisum] n=1 Tax=Lepeophtheirus salmonis TaxID=72036 RepID=A0A0K2UMB4_LEPSM
MEVLITTMKIRKKSRDGYLKAYLPWQKGILLSTKYLKSLYNDLVENGPLTCILTTRLKQDFVENFFSGYFEFVVYLVIILIQGR